MITLDQFMNVEYPKIFDCIKQSRAIVISGANFLKTLIDERVYDRGVASDNEDISSLVIADTLYEGGPYSEGHGERRVEDGLQTGFIDLQFSGEMRQDFDVVVGDDQVVIGFVTESAALLKRYHEDYREKEIFLPTEEELNLLVQFFDREYSDFISACLV